MNTLIDSTRFHHHLRHLLPVVLTGAGLFVLSAMAGRAQTVINLDFNSGDLSAFTQSSGVSPVVQGISLGQTAGVGTGGSGGVAFVASPAATDVTAIYSAASFNFTTGTTYTFSTDYHKKSAAGIFSEFQVGFFADNNVTTSSSNRYIGFRIVGQGVTGAANTYQLQLNNRDNSTTDVGLGSTFTIADSNTDWYRLSGALALTDAASKTFSYTISLWSIGSDGTGTPTLLQSVTSTFVNVQLATDTSLWYGFRDQTGTVSAVDNLSVVPEPKSVALLMGAGLMLIVSLRLRSGRAV